MAWNGVEHRKSKRYGVKNSTVAYKKSSLFSFLTPPSDKYLVLNISEGGCAFITRENLTPGLKLILYIEQPKIDRIIRAVSRVVWSKTSEKFNVYRVGVQFQRLGETSRALLKAMLNGAIVDSIEISTKVYLKELEKL